MTKNQRSWDCVRFLFKYIANTQNTCPHAHAYTRTHRIRRDTHSPKNAYKSGLIYRKTTWNPPKAFDCAPSFDGLDVTRACFDPFPWSLEIDESSIKVNEIKQTWWSYKYVVLRAIWNHSYNLKSVKNTHGGVLLLVKLQAKAGFSLQLYWK